MRAIISLNRNWKYAESFREEYVKMDCDERDFVNVDLPHTSKEVPYNYFDERMYQCVSCYRKRVFVPTDYRGRRVYIDFEGVMAYARVYLNGDYVGEHKGGYTPFSFDLTDKVLFGQNNVLVVEVDSTERPDIPPFGNVVDYLTYGGIYREVSLRIVNPVFIENVFARPQNVLSGRKKVEATIFVRNASKRDEQVELEVLLKRGERTIARCLKPVCLPNTEEHQVEVGLDDLSDIELWSLDRPNLYTFQVLMCTNGETVDSYETRIGFREAEVRSDGFFLNGQKLQLRGLNRHQSFPYVGYAMPKRVQRRDADILKNELHLNVVRTSHYPQSSHFLDRCDEIGLLVFEEIPGWQYIGDAEWKRVARQNLREMIQRDWNHPSIFLWGVRVNESADDHEFYTETNRIAHELDPTRQTGGVRYIPGSELLEDVFTVNDFSHQGGKVVLQDPKNFTGTQEYVPYLVTEYNGHMFPTKRFDPEERQIEHALRHLRVQNRAGLDPHISGAIGWCAFDYNTHHEFGSGDRICYHGVMDMFRIPKFAAHAYSSQVDPGQEVILEPVTLWTRGERSGAGVIPLVIFTNCDFIELYADGHCCGRYYPANDEFPGVPHPPVIIRKAPEAFGQWGFRWPDGEFVGYVAGREVVRRTFCRNPVAAKLQATADDSQLLSGDVDATRVVYKVLDQAGNLVPYVNDFIKFNLAGPGTIIGPKETALVGGCIAVWIKTSGEKGEIVLSAKSGRLTANEVCIIVD